jgi:hypothetical protein
MLLAHIAGVPVEETALSMAPIATVLGGVALRNLRRGAWRRSSPAKPPRLPAGDAPGGSRRP